MDSKIASIFTSWEVNLRSKSSSFRKMVCGLMPVADSNEHPHDGDIDLNGSFATENPGKHRHAFLSENMKGGISDVDLALSLRFQIGISSYHVLPWLVET